MKEIKEESKIDIEEAKNILDRIIGFVNNCDNKIAIALGIYGVVFAIIFTDGGITSLKNIINKSIKENNILYTIIILIIAIIILYGLSNFIRALIARKDVEKFKDKESTKESCLFWGDICKKESYKMYLEKTKHISKDEYLNDLITQIYLNSKICVLKYRYYNQGLKVTTIGFCLFIAVWITGMVIY